MGIAFIQDKLEIKFLILYIVSRLTEPVDGADLQDTVSYTHLTLPTIA